MTLRVPDSSLGDQLKPRDLAQVSARFDDPRPGGRSLQFGAPVHTLVAGTRDEVRDVVAAAGSARDEGFWVAGYVAYEAAPAFDEALVTLDPDPALPLAWFGVHEQPLQQTGWPATGEYRLGAWRSDTDERTYRACVAEIHDRIRHGDTYQTNYTLRLRNRIHGDHRGLYQDMVAAQWAGFGALLEIGSHAILSASPELFLFWDPGHIETRPMKGTVARGRWYEEDQRRRDVLLGSEKIRAENVMIVDLLRNDLGRVAEFGSVRVDELFTAEPYPTVWQLTSSVRATPRPDLGLVDVFDAMFPCGSVTGAPKASTMKLIAECELAPRGVYCGAIGVMAPDSSGHPRAVFSVAIRTLVIDLASGDAVYGTGGGIVADSDVDDEYEEALLKASVLTRKRPPVGLIETMLWTPASGIWLRDRHVERLTRSAEVLGIPLDRAVVHTALNQVSGREQTIIRLVLDPAGRVSVETRLLAEPGDGEVLLAVDSVPVDRDDVHLYHKVTDRTRYDEAAARHRDVDDVVLINDLGHCTETTVGNLVVEVDGRWVTPPIESGLLAGTYRAELLGSGKIAEEVVTIDQLFAADRVAVINSVRGWRSASVVG
jgi:para-aminobenzoate synthetase/4-amino-4-deoxychorismate lyase